MPVLVNDCEGTGTATSGSGGTNGWDSIDLVTGGVATYDTTVKLKGTSSLKLTSNVDGTTASNAYARWVASLGTITTTVWWRAYLYVPSAPSALARVIAMGGGPSVRMNTSRQLQVISTGGSTMGTSTALPAATWVRLEGKFVPSGTPELKIFSSVDSTTPSETPSITGSDTATTYTDIRYGFSGTAVVATQYFDAVGVSTSSYLGPYYPPASAGSLTGITGTSQNVTGLVPGVYDFKIRVGNPGPGQYSTTVRVTIPSS